MPNKQNNGVANRAWRLLRLALLWTRKGGVFKRRLLMELRVVNKYLRSLAHQSSNHDLVRYGERELSFDKTPIFQVKMHRPAPSMRHLLLPCITPHDVDFDCDLDRDGDYDHDRHCEEYGYGYGYDCGRKSFLGGRAEEVDGDCQGSMEEDDGIDLRAEKFIANFYEQIKLQRQISYLQYNEMLNRGTS